MFSADLELIALMLIRLGLILAAAAIAAAPVVSNFYEVQGPEFVARYKRSAHYARSPHLIILNESAEQIMKVRSNNTRGYEVENIN